METSKITEIGILDTVNFKDSRVLVVPWAFKVGGQWHDLVLEQMVVDLTKGEWNKSELAQKITHVYQRNFQALGKEIAPEQVRFSLEGDIAKARIEGTPPEEIDGKELTFEPLLELNGNQMANVHQGMLYLKHSLVPFEANFDIGVKEAPVVPPQPEQNSVPVASVPEPTAVPAPPTPPPAPQIPLPVPLASPRVSAPESPKMVPQTFEWDNYNFNLFPNKAPIPALKELLEKEPEDSIFHKKKEDVRKALIKFSKNKCRKKVERQIDSFLRQAIEICDAYYKSLKAPVEDWYGKGLALHYTLYPLKSVEAFSRILDKLGASPS